MQMKQWPTIEKNRAENINADGVLPTLRLKSAEGIINIAAKSLSKSKKLVVVEHYSVSYAEKRKKLSSIIATIAKSFADGYAAAAIGH